MALAAMAIGAMPSIAHSQEQAPKPEREFCADRPGLGTPACTLAPGAAMIEIGLAAWDHSRSRTAIDDTVTAGDFLLRVGVTDTMEAQIGVTSYVRTRRRDRPGGRAARRSGPGDAVIALRQGLTGANGPLAAQAFVTLPLAGDGLGAGGWSGGVLLPAAIDLAGDLQLELTPELDVLPNAERRGRHLAWGGVVGLSHPLGDALSATAELSAFRDHDPDGHSTDARVAGSLVWQVSETAQVDFELDAGLTSAAPGRTLAVGVAWKFR